MKASKILILGLILVFIGSFFSWVNFSAAQIYQSLWYPGASGLQPVESTWTVYSPDDFRFDDEILPDGDLCANTEILQKTGADDWDCVAIPVKLTEEQVEDYVGTMLGGTETRITVDYVDGGVGAGSINFVVDAETDPIWIAASSTYLTTSTAASTYLPLAGGTITGTLTVSGTSTFATTTITGDLIVNTDDLFIDTATGRVGIGTTTPRASLEISGGGNALYIADGNNARIVIGDTTGASDYGELRWDTTGNYLGLDADSARPLVLQEDGGNVGIGATSPFQKLTLTSGHYIAWETTAGQANSRSWGIRNDYDNFGDFAIRSSNANDNTLDTTRMVINKDGKVGIGTSTPSVMLSVGATSTQQFLVNNLGVISDGVWEGTVIADAYIASSTEYLTDTTYWTDGGTFTYLASTTDDVVFGGNTTSSPFWFNVGEANFTVGIATSGDSVIDFYASATRTWTMGLDDSDLDMFKISTSSDFTSGAIFSINATGTLIFGDNGISACLKIRDSDDAGYTYCQTLNGAMNCTTTSCD